MHKNIYMDIAKRTAGDVYIGVVGPVRTGKSTFIKKFMEALVIDKIEDEIKRARTIDELPQSADGRTIMTTEPKFVPAEAVKINLDKATINVRLIDCVGYVVEGAAGHLEGEKPRMVRTPWNDSEIPFQEAAIIGTNKVIRDHCTIAVAIIADDSITGIAREKYDLAEVSVIKELKAIGKPFVVVLNSINSKTKETQNLAKNLSVRYDTSVIPLDIANGNTDDFATLLNRVLMEFPINTISINLPKWMKTLAKENEVIVDILDAIRNSNSTVVRMKDYDNICKAFENSNVLENNPDIEADAGTGKIRMNFRAKEGAFYRVLSQECGISITDEQTLMTHLIKTNKGYNSFEKLREALEEAELNGYGIVIPSMDQLELVAPELVKKGDQYGVKLRANAPSMHIVRVDVESEISPTIGSVQQSEDLVRHMKNEFENNKSDIWNANLFGKSLSDLVKDDISSKINGMPMDVRRKIKKTMTRVINESRGGVLCILL
ncbi:MAG: stage IV sporulation protein A [Christensenellaceae bacterium]|nr:stage IV sporulation protein A [Christensenellaceae bacterium]